MPDKQEGLRQQFASWYVAKGMDKADGVHHTVDLVHAFEAGHGRCAELGHHSLPVEGENEGGMAVFREDNGTTWCVPALVVVRLTQEQFDAYMDTQKLVFSAHLVQP